MRKAGRRPDSAWSPAWAAREIYITLHIFHIPRSWPFQPYNDTATRRLYAHANPFLDTISRLFFRHFFHFVSRFYPAVDFHRLWFWIPPFFSSAFWCGVRALPSRQCCVLKSVLHF